MESDILLASLPTSKDHVPSDLEVKYGCLNIPERMLNIFVFLAGEMWLLRMTGHLLHLMRILLFMAPILIPIRLDSWIYRSVWRRLLLKK